MDACAGLFEFRHSLTYGKSLALDSLETPSTGRAGVPRAMLQPGTHIGRYEIQRKLARGGMGVVYVAHDPVLGRMVALKVFQSDLDLPDAAERFAREARAAASLNHTNIVTIYDFGEVASQPYIVMEYIQGETLADIIRRRTPVPVAEKIRWLEEVCAGAASAHKMDVIHRDIKPGNLIIDQTGRLKILDFGIAKIVNSLGAAATAVIGTPGYMAPEQLLGRGTDARTDVFSIGIVAFELLTYEEAFAGDSFTAVTHRVINEDVRHLSELVPDAPTELSAVIERALQKNPAERFQTAESLRQAFSRVRRQLETAVADEPSPEVTLEVPRATLARRADPGRANSPAIGSLRSTPPPDPVAERDAAIRERTARLQSVLERGQAYLQNGELDRARDASAEALAMDGTNAAAVALQQRVSTAVGRQRAAAVVADAEGELARGALTRCQELLEEARHLDPDAPIGRLKRDLRLARVEQERLRLRSETRNRTIAAARAALDRGDVEGALALAREALTLDPGSEDARGIETAALRRIEETTGSGTAERRVDDLPDERTVIALPRPSTRRPTAVPADTARARTDDVDLPHAHPTGPVAPPLPIAGTVTTPAGQVTPTPARPHWADRWRTAVAAARDTVRALPRRQLQVGLGIALVILVGAGAVATLLRRAPAPVPVGILVIEAVPWAQVSAITGPDGRNHLAAPVATPVSQSLPTGTYTVVLTGPPPASEPRTLSVDVGGDGVTVAPAARFPSPTGESYFQRVVGEDAVAPAPVAAPPTSGGGAP